MYQPKELGICEKCGVRPCISTRRDRCEECDPWCRQCETRERRWGSRYCNVCQAERRRNWYNNDPENRSARLASNKASNERMQIEVRAAYGNKCACPGCDVDWPEFLTLDHIDGDGAEERRETGLFGGTQFWRYVRNLGCPQDKYQLLCWNCNLAKHIFGQCPHVAKLELVS